jgi:ABC-2 type transport system ATP-binding protein
MHAGRLAALGTVAELKRIFHGRAVVEVRTASPMAALRALDDLPTVEKTSPFGTALHVWLKPGVLDTGPLRQRLENVGLAVESFEFVQPSLEDVFMDVVEREERAAV